MRLKCKFIRVHLWFSSVLRGELLSQVKSMSASGDE
jgi:hypothetical protein